MRRQLLRSVQTALLGVSAAVIAYTPLVAAPQTAATASPAKKGAAPQPAAKGKLFGTPEAARDALVTAATAKDDVALAAIFGPDHEKLKSGDAVQDKYHADRFALHVQEGCTLQPVSETKYTLIVGARKFPFSIPLVKDGEQWRFDTAAGIQEILNRRIGANELSAIMTARAYALAQWEYFGESSLYCEQGLSEYAQKFISAPGQHDGLFWETAPDEQPSPLGPLVAEARAEGYNAGRASPTASAKPASTGAARAGAAEESARTRTPYHGYYFKILTRQGASAPGGAFSYLINGHMIAGFALVAYPAEWGNSGVMTFVVNTQGRVYEKNLGAKTAELALAMREYNPDPSWKLVPKE